MKRNATALVIQGGGFKTAFTAGVLDAFHACSRPCFDLYVAVSGGAIALSYYLSAQYGDCYKAIALLASDPHFVQFSRTMSEQGYMNIDYLEKIARDVVPLDLVAANKNRREADIRFVVTSRDKGHAEYMSPLAQEWIDLVIGSCTLPLVTKGVHTLQDRAFFDGGWSDPIPAEWAANQGASEILVLRTSPISLRIKQSWPDYLSSIYYRAQPELSTCFAESHLIYNKALDFMEKKHKDLNIYQIAPDQALKSGTYIYTADTLLQDYRHGLDLGLRYMESRSGAH